jgi:hypothetical protein
MNDKAEPMSSLLSRSYNWPNSRRGYDDILSMLLLQFMTAPASVMNGARTKGICMTIG